MKKCYQKPTVEKIDFDYRDNIVASSDTEHGHGNGSNNGRWGDGNPNSDNGGYGHGAWHGGKNPH